MTGAARHILWFAGAFAFFILAPPFLGQPFPAYPLIHWADVLDLLTPLVLIPLYWELFTQVRRDLPGKRMTTAFLVLSALWVMGQGMHLSANSIGNLQGAGSTELHRLVHFYDEDLSHWLWHSAIVGLSVLILLRQEVPSEIEVGIAWAAMLPAAILYGFTYFAAFNEGGTVLLGLPAAVAICLGLFLGRRLQLARSPMVAFFLFAHLIAIVLFAGWFAYWGGFPEFSQTGLL